MDRQHDLNTVFIYRKQRSRNHLMNILEEKEPVYCGKKEAQAQKRAVLFEFLDRKSGLVVCRNE